MMESELLTWSLQSSGLLIVVFTAYYFLFRNNTSFQLRRSLILITLLLCLFAPSLTIEVKPTHPVLIQQVAESKPILVKPAVDTPEFVLNERITATAESPNQAIPWLTYATWAYYAGVSISLLFLIIELGRIYYWKITGQKDTALHPNVIRHFGVKAPFSFGSHIFLPQQPEYSAEVWAIIHQHESTHTQQRHTLDLIFARLLQAIFWYNPIIFLIQKELTVIHEALADRTVLKTISLSNYVEVLMQVSLAENHQSIGHSFALLSTLSKRLKMMKTRETKIQKTILNLICFMITSIGIIGWSSVYAQQNKNIKSEITVEQVPYKVEELMSFPFRIGIISKLSKEHQKAFEKIKLDNPEKKISFRYFEENDFSSYFESYKPGYKPIYIDNLSQDQKYEIYNLVMADTSKISLSFNENGKSVPHYYTYKETVSNLEEIILNTANYLMIYESTPSKLSEDGVIFNSEEVDQIPEVVGGIENLAKSIALNISVPTKLSKDKLPESVDFEFVVRGGNSISHLTLLTELKGSEKNNLPYYRFFGEIHNELKSKISTIYPWKRGMKDGEEVLVRMKISIPTNYMQ